MIVSRPHLVPAAQPQETPFYVPAASQPPRDRRSLKQDDTFAVLDSHGDIGLFSGGAEGLFNRDTRYISRLEMLINGVSPLLLDSYLRDDNTVLTVDLTNPDFYEGDVLRLHRDSLHIRRTAFLWKDAAYFRFGLQNLANQRIQFDLSMIFASDFADIFEVRGIHRPRRGYSEVLCLPDGRQVDLLYRGLDRQKRVSSLLFDPKPDVLARDQALYRLSLEPHRRCSLFLTVCINPRPHEEPRSLLQSMTAAGRTARRSKARRISLQTSSDAFNQVFARSIADLDILMTESDGGPYPYAGVPWYSTVFGRDGLITALEMLWCEPSVAEGALVRLAALQATVHNPAHDAEPGKIIHEMRDGEMAHLAEVPFGRYYGSIDSTPLFLMLAGAYAARTDNYALIEQLWPSIEAALAWIDTYGDQDGDGFVEYSRRSVDGLVNQGWKDSHDSVFHRNGELARGPIALAEVQAYVYEARRCIASCARALGRNELADKLEKQSQDLFERFDSAFWCEELGTYALALDGDKRRCEVRTSNAGHVLWCGLARPERAQRVVRNMMLRSFMSGWGIRTVAEGEARYNPISYHNGSIWPHDNALIAGGFSRYGCKAEAAIVFQAVAGAASYMEFRRLPELYCGFRRKFRQAPTLYPTACAPQAWASAAPFALLKACMGLEIEAAARKVVVNKPVLPFSLDSVAISNLDVGGHRVDFVLRKRDADYELDVLRKDNGLQVELRT